MSKTKSFYLGNLLIFFLGLISSFSLPPYNYWILNFLTFSLLIVFLFKNKHKSPKIFAIYGFLFGFGYLSSSLYWIPLSLLHDENFKFLIPFAIIVIPAFLSLFFALAFFTFRFFLSSKSVFISILIFSVILGFFEYLRGVVFSGFPWNLFAFSLSENLKFLQINSLIGIYAFNTFLITMFSTPAILILNNKKKDLYGLFMVISIALLNYYFGYIKVENFKNLKKNDLPIEIKILSTNVPIERFYSNVDEEKILEYLINLSNPSFNKKTIFIWPEGIIPNFNLPLLKNEYDFLFKKSFSENHRIILGLNDYQIENNKEYIYNSFVVIDNELDVIYKYYKNKLVPFGEYLPLESLFSKIGLRSLTNNYQSYSSSKIRDLFNLDLHSTIKILPLICYEIIYSGQLSLDDDYNFIVNLSEDGWFGDSIGPYQHFAHSIFRSIEYGRYTLRSANNGISAIVDPSGAVIDKINIKNDGVISLKKMTNVDKTLISTHGNKIYYFFILLYIFLIFSFKKLENE